MKTNGNYDWQSQELTLKWRNQNLTLLTSCIRGNVVEIPETTSEEESNLSESGNESDDESENDTSDSDENEDDEGDEEDDDDSDIDQNYEFDYNSPQSKKFKGLRRSTRNRTLTRRIEDEYELLYGDTDSEV